MEDVENLLRSLGVGCRHPKDIFFREGNEINRAYKVYGISEVDSEEFCHKTYSKFSCHVHGCTVTFESVIEYDQHYNSCHRFSCSQCHKYLPTMHLLDLHLAETHDAYFAVEAEKKPMYRCYVEDCKTVLSSYYERKDHCIKVHNFPKEFRYDQKKNRKKGLRHKGENNVNNERRSNLDENMKMDVSLPEKSNGKKKREKQVEKNPKVKKTNFGNKRKPKLNMKGFVKDLQESLPL